MNKYNIKIKYHYCDCSACRKFNNSTVRGYFTIRSNNIAIKGTSIEIPTSIIQKNEFRTMLYLFFLTYKKRIVTEKSYRDYSKWILNIEND